MARKILKSILCCSLSLILMAIPFDSNAIRKPNRNNNNNKKNVVLNLTEVELKVHEYVGLTANQSVTWSSNNKKVATVDKWGTVVATGEGTAIITARNNRGKKATCRVNVNGIYNETEQPIEPEMPEVEQPVVPETPKPEPEIPKNTKMIGFNRSVWSTDVNEVCDRVREMKVNELTLSVKFNIPSLTSNTVTVDKTDLNRAKQIMDNLASDGTLNNINVIFEPYPYVNSGEDVETTFNPTNDTLFLDNWQSCINNTLKEFDEYEFWGVYVNSNMDSLMDNVDKWQDIYDGVKELQPKANVMVRTNWWWSDYDEPEYNGYGLNTRKTHAYYKIWDVLAIASYFELADVQSASEDQIYNWLINGTAIWGRNQKIVEEIEGLHKATGKPIFFGELGLPSKQGALACPYEVNPSNKNDETTQANLFKAYYKAFKDKDWWLGFSVYAVGDDGNYDITGKQAGDYITNLNAIENFK